MKVIQEIGISEFQAWSGAVSTLNTIVESGMADEFTQMIEELYPDGLTDTQLNDILWFEEEWILESLGISEDEETEEEDEEE